MKWKAPKNELISILKNMTFPKSVLLIVASGQINFTSSDNTVMTKSHVEAIIDEVGSACVSATVLYDILTKLRGDYVTFETKEQTLLVKGLKTTVSIALLDMVNFPYQITEPDNWLFTIQSSDLKKAIKKTNHAIQSEKVPDTLKGLQIQASGNELIFIGTDKKQFAMFKLELPSEEHFEAIIPKEHLKWLENILGSGEVSFALQDNFGVFATSTHVLYTRTLNGPYPSLLKMLALKPVCKITLDSDVLINSVELATVTADKTTTKGTKLVYLSTKEDGLTIVARNELGSTNDYIEAATEGDEVKVVYDSSHLIHAVKAAAMSKAELGFVGADSPLIISGDEGTYVISAIKSREVF